MVDTVKRIVIAGGGTAGWMTAAALSQIMGEQLSLALIESEEIGSVGVGEATIPMIAHFNALLRLDENDFLRETKGTIKLGIAFEGWRHEGHSYMHAFGTLGRDLGSVPFHHYWLQAHLDGQDDDLWAYSLNERAAYANRFAPLNQIPNTPLPGMPYAYHFDASLYALYLRRLAEAKGARRIEGRIRDIALHAETGHVTRLSLEDGQQVEGDLFIDCSGFRGLLIEGALKTGFESWRHLLPCDRAWAVPCESVSPLTPYTRSIAREAGWQWRIPLQHRTGNGYVFCSDHISEDEAATRLLSRLDGQALADPRLIRFETGRRRLQWNGNVIALGLSSGFIEPLESTSIHLIQSGIARLITLFPHAGFDPAVVAEYNRQSALEFELIRDFIVLHYHANERHGEAFWDQVRHMAIPDALAHKMTLFRASGLIQPNPNDLFQLPAWLQVMVGQNVRPAAAHPFVAAVPEAARQDYLANLRTIIGRAANGLPTHEAYIAQHCRAV
ncbi:MAG: tryptophan 7-halogenase [Asticcacaulis sp.]|uniref:tryptophan halogenase family protein n=1 Tax=Asticcacaulis sp. TaxID=1872648 RepID=UPI0025C1B9E0|nr:tryptophan halogenase family protein [Asticcacaulis sp.]MCA1934887.1 tryptophan 7-halogenase [Asticcacaulis sp.]